MFTVDDIIFAMTENGDIQIFVEDTLFEFPMNDVPDSIAALEVQSIDNPEFNEKPHPLCLNIEWDEDECGDFDKFKEENKQYIH